MASPDAEESALPAAIPLECPACGEETDHAVLKGTVGLRGDYTLDAVVRCETCGTVRHIVHREAGERELPVILSSGAQSRRTKLLAGDDEELAAGDEVVIDGVRSVITAVETREGRRPPALPVPEIATIWAKEFEQVKIGFTINLGKKTIAKELVLEPEDRLEIGEQRVFGNLRVTIHGIKITDRMLRRGGAEAGQITRVFAKPTKDTTEGSRPRRTAPAHVIRKAKKQGKTMPSRGRKPGTGRR